MSEPSAPTRYVLVCLNCGGPELPFTSPAERATWAIEHSTGTGHDRWLTADQNIGIAELTGGECGG